MSSVATTVHLGHRADDPYLSPVQISPWTGPIAVLGSENCGKSTLGRSLFEQLAADPDERPVLAVDGAPRTTQGYSRLARDLGGDCAAIDDFAPAGPPAVTGPTALRPGPEAVSPPTGPPTGNDAAGFGSFLDALSQSTTGTHLILDPVTAILSPAEVPDETSWSALGTLVRSARCQGRLVAVIAEDLERELSHCPALVQAVFGCCPYKLFLGPSRPLSPTVEALSRHLPAYVLEALGHVDRGVGRGLLDTPDGPIELTITPDSLTAAGHSATEDRSP